jgi:putative transposase
MSRQHRFLFPGAVYHLGARGYEKSFIFRDDKHKQRLVEIFTRAKKNYGLIIYAYAIMGNHYHILIETPEPNLPVVMHFINMSYGSYYNTRQGRKGYVFERRYSAFVVQKDEPMKRQVQYIHMNPIRAKIEETLGTYKWTSHNQYMGLEKNGIADCSFVLSLFGNDTKNAILAYESYMARSRIFSKTRIEMGVYGKAIIGDEDFVRQIKLMIDNKDLSDEINCRKELKKIYEPQTIINAVNDYYGISEEALCRKSGCWNVYKKIAIFLLKTDCGLSGADIGRAFDMHQGSASKALMRLQAKLEKDRKLRKQIEEIRSKYAKINEMLIK